MPAAAKPKSRLPRSFQKLVAMMPPQAIMDEVHYDNTVDIIDQLMATASLTRDQSLYLETLVQLVQAYEAKHHVIETDELTGIDLLRHLMDANDLSASDLGRLLGVHPSMGSKILNGDRALTVQHLRTLAERFGVRPELFM